MVVLYSGGGLRLGHRAWVSDNSPNTVRKGPGSSNRGKYIRRLRLLEDTAILNAFRAAPRLIYSTDS